MSDTELARLEAEHRARLDDVAEAHRLAREAKQALDTYRLEHNLLSTFAPPSVETDDDRAAAAAWAAQMDDLAHLGEVERAELIVAQAKGIDLSGLAG